MPSTEQVRQDRFNRADVSKMILNEDVMDQGKYDLDIGSGGDVKVSRMKRRWIQREDVGH